MLSFNSSDCNRRRSGPSLFKCTFYSNICNLCNRTCCCRYWYDLYLIWGDRDYLAYSNGRIRIYDFCDIGLFTFRKKISLKERLLLKEAFNNDHLSGMVRLVKRILIFTAIIELTGGLILSIRFSFDMPLGRALYYGFWHSISNFNNAGFDLMGNFNSLTGYVNDPTVVLTICALHYNGWIRFYGFK